MKILVYGAFKNAEKSENYKEKVKKYLNNNEKNITYYIDIVKNNKSEKTKWFEMLSYLLKKNADIIVIKSIEQLVIYLIYQFNIISNTLEKINRECIF